MHVGLMASLKESVSLGSTMLGRLHGKLERCCLLRNGASTLPVAGGSQLLGREPINRS